MLRQTVFAKNLFLDPLIHYFSRAYPKNTECEVGLYPEWDASPSPGTMKAHIYKFFHISRQLDLPTHPPLYYWEIGGTRKKQRRPIWTWRVCARKLCTNQSSRSKRLSSRAVRHGMWEGRVLQWLRHWANELKVMSSIPSATTARPKSKALNHSAVSCLSCKLL